MEPNVGVRHETSGALKSTRGYRRRITINGNGKSVDLQMLANYLVVTKQRLQRTPQLAGWLEDKLRDRTRRNTEYHLLYGTGSNNELHGFFEDPDLSTVAWSGMTAGDTRADLVLKSAIAIPGNGPRTAVMHKNDWFKILKYKSSTDGHYVHTSFGPVRIINTPGLQAIGNVMVVTSDTVLEGESLVADFNAASELVDSGVAEITLGWFDKLFIQNKIAMLYEVELAHAILDPGAFVKASWDSAPA
jgi:HK97 family phage major capsid protein